MGERLRKLVIEFLGNEKFLPELSAKRLYAAGGVQYVAVVRKFAAEVPDFGGDDWAAVCRRLETWRLPVLADEFRGNPLEADAKVVEALYRAGAVLACRRVPGEECSVTRNLVDLAPVLFAAVREQLVVVLHKAAVLHVPEFFCEFGGVPQVYHHEHEVFFERFLRLAQERIPEHTRAELLVHGTHEGDEVGHQEEHQDLHLHRGAGKSRDDPAESVFVYYAFAALDPEEQNAEDNARADGGQKVQGADEQGFPYGPAVHFVLEDEDVVDSVRESHEKGELELYQHVADVECPGVCIGRNGRNAYGGNYPTKNVVADGAKFSLGLSCKYHWGLMDEQGKCPYHGDENDVLVGIVQQK